MTSNHSVTWCWNPPAAPPFGEVFESMIKSSQRAVYAALKDTDINDEELQTNFIGVESLMNSRPLTTLSDHPNDKPVLTPTHFLIGQMGSDFIPESVDSTAFNPRNTGGMSKNHSTCVGMLDERITIPHWLLSEAVLSYKNLKIGDVIMVIDACAARRDWKVGHVEHTYPDSGQLMRVVHV